MTSVVENGRGRHGYRRRNERGSKVFRNVQRLAQFAFTSIYHPAMPRPRHVYGWWQDERHRIGIVAGLVVTKGSSDASY